MLPMLTAAGYVLTLLASLYAVAALLCRPRSRHVPASDAKRGPVTVLKPLCGAEALLEENLATLCEQAGPKDQLLFGVRDPGDPAIAVVERLARRFPRLDIELVVDPSVHGTNLKVSNLINMTVAVRHPWLVLADSDIAVPPGYLEQVAAPLADPDVGIVTCLYHGRPLGGFWTRMGALFIDTWFVPSVRVASALGSSGFGFGATIALRADTLHAIGGFDVLRNRLADDFWLGELARRQGLATVISSVYVSTDVVEDDLPSLWSRERRWMKTIRSINPWGYSFSFVTFTWPMLAVGLWLAPTQANAGVAAVGLAARLGLHWRQPTAGVSAPGRAAYAPVRDCLLLFEWLSGFFGAKTRWRRHLVPVNARVEGDGPSAKFTDAPSNTSFPGSAPPLAKSHFRRVPARKIGFPPARE